VAQIAFRFIRQAVINVSGKLAPKLFQPVAGSLSVFIDNGSEVHAVVELPGADICRNQAYGKFKEFFFRHCDFLGVVMTGAVERCCASRHRNLGMSLTRAATRTGGRS